MNRRMLNIVAVGAVSLAIGLPPASAAAAETAVRPALPAERIEPTTAPFDPICPLCFVREFLETFS
ncbi:hypothetical protein ACWDO0_26385 [Nocardia rhamnosiphila]|uniref:Secreted protein n=1 Tax=Nocardia rhamnosiphila TaxID=426716 RepID=A0ABV2WTM3_9NOCA|nr:hypothetical protein [Nocardia rhamnosiphila]